MLSSEGFRKLLLMTNHKLLPQTVSFIIALYFSDPPFAGYAFRLPFMHRFPTMRDLHVWTREVDECDMLK
jgi:hypothetical protein